MNARTSLNRALMLCLAACVTIALPDELCAQTPSLLSDLDTGAPTTLNGGVAPLGVVGDRLLFLGYRSNSGTELWSTDGTAAGTDMVIDIAPGPTSIAIYTLPSEPYYLWATMNGVLYLNADDGTHGTQLWRSDGTAGGTWRVKRLNNSTNGASIRKMAVLGDLLVMTAPGTTIQESLWISDGSEAGTVEVRTQDLLGISGLTDFAELDGVIYFMAGSGGLWRTDGTIDGTSLVQASSSSLTPHMCVWNGAIYFTNAATGQGVELWKSDGTPSGTALLKETYPGSTSGGPASFIPTASHLYFFAKDADHGTELWRTDGTAGGTELAVEFTPGAASTFRTATPAVPINGGLLLNLIYNTGPQSRLWMTDGTQAGTTALTSPSSSLGSDLVAVDGAAYFSFNAASTGDQELWRTDGTVAGTYLVREIQPGSGGSYPKGLFRWGSDLYFTADDGTHGTELWKSDGTTGGTAMVADVCAPVSRGGPASNAFLDVNGRMFLVQGNNRLYSSDGTSGGTLLLKQFNSMMFPPQWANIGGTLMLGAQSGSYIHLWKSDGSATGTVDVTPSFTSLDPRNIVSLDGVALFMGRDPALGYELFRSDGTEPGTYLVSDINAGPSGSSPSNLFPYSDMVLFFATTPANGMELWRTDGTSAGTSLVLDIFPGTGSSSSSGFPPSFIEYNGVVYFIATDGTSNYELWRTDGTAAGTSMVVDLNPGAGSGLQRSLAVHDGWLYFAGNDGQSNGWSLFRTDGTLSGTSLVYRFGSPTSDSHYVVETCSGSDALYFVEYSSDLTKPTNLWRSDGTESGTVLFQQIGPSHNYLSGQGPGLRAIDGVPYYPSWSADAGAEIWTTNGTQAGTHAIEVAAGPASGNSFLVLLGAPAVNAASGHYFYFMGDDGVTGLEPWVFVLPSRPFCLSDFNRDDFVTGEDFDSFVLEFELGNAGADVNEDTFVTGEDFDLFVERFVAGC